MSLSTGRAGQDRAALSGKLDSYRGARALVLGGTGFIGHWVARALVHLGAKTIVTSRHDATARPRPLDQDIQSIKIDLEDPDAVSGLLRRVQPDITFNLAGYGVDSSERDEGQARRINTELVGVLCDSLTGTRARRWPHVALVHAGSAAEYGRIGGNLSESSSARPTGMYASSKLAGTLELEKRASALGLPAVTARLFTVFGPGEHPDRLLPSLIAAAAADQPIDLTGGSQQRDFTYVEDAAEGLLRLGVSTASPGDVVNLATGTLMSVREFATTAADLLGMPTSQLRFGTLRIRPDEMAHDPVAIDRLLELVSWSPPTSVREGIQRTVARLTGAQPGKGF